MSAYEELKFLDSLSGSFREIDKLIVARMNKLAAESTIVVPTVNPIGKPGEFIPVNKAGVANMPEKSSGFKFGATSEKELVGVKEALVHCVRRALLYTTQDFMVFDGLRTKQEQAEHVRKGNSRTMNSKHLLGLAVDLVPFIGNKPVWDWDGCYKVALAMDEAATDLGIADRITWGGAWDRRLSDFGGSPDAYKKEVEAYRKRHEGSDFIDGPHFEWRS